MPIIEIMSAEQDKGDGVKPETKETAPTQTQKDKAPAVEDETEDFPDPDEDDLDDLDGNYSRCGSLRRSKSRQLTRYSEFLDEFSVPKPELRAPSAQPNSGAPSAPAKSSTAPTPPVPAPTDDDDPLLDDELARELEKGMADFFGGLENNVRPVASHAPSPPYN